MVLLHPPARKNLRKRKSRKHKSVCSSHMPRGKCGRGSNGEEGKAGMGCHQTHPTEFGRNAVVVVVPNWLRISLDDRFAHDGCFTCNAFLIATLPRPNVLPVARTCPKPYIYIYFYIHDLNKHIYAIASNHIYVSERWDAINEEPWWRTTNTQTNNERSRQTWDRLGPAIRWTPARRETQKCILILTHYMCDMCMVLLILYIYIYFNSCVFKNTLRHMELPLLSTNHNKRATQWMEILERWDAEIIFFKLG